MAKKEKTLDDLDLREIVAGVHSATTIIGMYADKADTLKKILNDPSFSGKFFSAVSDLQSHSTELSKRFYAPAHYRD